MAATPTTVRVCYAVPRSRPDWTLPEEPVPESQDHDQTLDLLKAILLAWVSREGRSATVARNLAVRWDETRPRVGVDPDLCVIEPSPPDESLDSLLTWKPGHRAPRLAVEVVSPTHPYKDYAVAPEKYAALGVEELWVFDPKLAGPRARGGPHRIMVWRRSEGDFELAYAGDGPAHSSVVNGWLFAVSEGRRLRIAEDREGTRWWRTEAEQAREATDAALARVAELEARLAARR